MLKHLFTSVDGNFEMSLLQMLMEMLIGVLQVMIKKVALSFLQVLMEMLKCLFTSVDGNIEMSFLQKK